MSATELLEQIKSLPPREQRKIFDGVHQLEARLDARPDAAHRKPVRWPDAAARRRRILGDKVLPNLVLVAREEERF